MKIGTGDSLATTARALEMSEDHACLWHLDDFFTGSSALLPVLIPGVARATDNGQGTRPPFCGRVYTFGVGFTQIPVIARKGRSGAQLHPPDSCAPRMMQSRIPLGRRG